MHTAQGSTGTVLSGTFTVLWGDGNQAEPGSTLHYFLTMTNGQQVRLLVDENSLDWLRLNRQPVHAFGSWVQSLDNSASLPVFLANSMVLDTQAGGEAGPEDIIGPQPWVSIMCKFADVSAEPRDLAYFQGMYSASYPGLDHYWREQSYGIANLEGSQAFGWYVLPHERAYYLPGGNLDWWTAAADCTAAADAYVDFSPYVGINLMFNDILDCCAWGGSWYACLDGVCKLWRTTWEPPWGYENIGVIAHETGHGFGLPHSSGDYGQTYDNQWDVMSDLWSNGSRGGTHPVYGVMGQHTISFHKEMLGWFSEGQTLLVPVGRQQTITLERLALPDTTDFLGAVVPIDGSSDRFMTVEARQLIGYDAWLPHQTGWNQAIILHDVDVTRDNPAHVVDIDFNGNTGDGGAIFLPGEIYMNPTYGIYVTVRSAISNGFIVTINNQYTGVDIYGVEAGQSGMPYDFIAEFAPPDSVPPVTYTWEATGQAPVTHTTGLTDSVSYTWDTSGNQTITVTALSSAGAYVNTHAVEIAVAPSGVALNGPVNGYTAQTLPFTAVVTSAETTLPITYTWSVDGQVVMTHTMGLTDTVDLSFDLPGVHVVQVEASNIVGSISAEWELIIAMRTYLPFVLRN
jgi:hypothetical protein